MKHLLTLCAMALTSGFLVLSSTGCSSSRVAERQNAITNMQGEILDRRAARLQARDERMTSSRELWMR